MNRKIVFGIVFLATGYTYGSVYNCPKNYSGNYVSPTARKVIILTNSSPEITEIIANNQTPGTWAVNQRKGDAGYVNQLIGTAPDTVSAMVMDSNGVFTVVGSSAGQYAMMSRFLANGSLDTTFGSMGYVNFDIDATADSFTSVIFDASGQGYYLGISLDMSHGIMHVTNAGAIDTSFGTMGLFTAVSATFQSVIGVALQSTGNIVYTGLGSLANSFAVGRITPAGVADSSFTVYDPGASIVPKAIAVDSEDRIIVVGTAVGSALRVYRLLPNGALDTSFNGTGYFSLAGTNGLAVAVLSDDSIIAVGDNAAHTEFKVVKLNDMGVLDTTFGAGTGIVTPFPGIATTTAQAVTLLPHGMIAVSGQSDNNFVTVLLNSDGSLNPQFTIAGQTTIPGTAKMQIQLKSKSYGIGYQNIPDSGLVVSGVTYATVADAVGAVFYTDAAVK